METNLNTFTQDGRALKLTSLNDVAISFETIFAGRMIKLYFKDNITQDNALTTICTGTLRDIEEIINITITP
jgi:hypothetical protein|tara:strand:+ start:7625 stop:7840 length:216 start_codon:yes stop_codon:yes gene_type:complete